MGFRGGADVTSTSRRPRPPARTPADITPTCTPALPPAMPPAALSVAILIVSTTAATDPAADKSSQLLRSFLAASSHESLVWEVAESRIVGDDAAAIQAAICEWTAADSGINLVLTTGGTGFAVSDITPEAVKPLLQKQAPGLV